MVHCQLSSDQSRLPDVVGPDPQAKPRPLQQRVPLGNLPNIANIAQQTRDVHPLLALCWPTVFDAGSTLTQVRSNVFFFAWWICIRARANPDGSFVSSQRYVGSNPSRIYHPGCPYTVFQILFQGLVCALLPMVLYTVKNY